MQNKIQKITDKIYQEGISKGNAEAEAIVSDARKEASQIISEAKKEADSIMKEAKKKSEEIVSNGNAEFKLSSKQALNALKQQITDIINGEILHTSVSSVFNDRQFVQKIIEQAVKNWNTGAENPDISVLVPVSEEKKLIEYFTSSAKKMLDKGLEIKADENIKTGFQISPQDGGYKISFTGNDFENFLKQYLRPKLVELLFVD